MKWYKDLYMGELAAKRKRKIISRIKHGKVQIGVYVLALPLYDDNILDIYPSYILNQKYYRNIAINIVGIACGYEEAMEVLQRMVIDCYTSTGQFKICDMTEDDKFS